MSELLEPLAAGIAERVCTRIRAQDRVDALDEGVDGPTLLDRIGSDGGAALHGLVASALGDLLHTLGDARERDALRAVRASEPAGPSEELMRNGMVLSSWDGSSVTASPLGEASLQLFDRLVADVEAGVRERLRIGDAR